MPTFILKKYSDKKDDEIIKVDTKEQQPQEEKELTIDTSDTIAETIYNALNKVLTKKGIEVIRKEENSTKESTATAISTEDINTNLDSSLNMLNSNIILITHKGYFKTANEEKFLDTLYSKNIKPFFSLESFIRYIEKYFSIKE